jgi:hypothetical protein
VHSRRAILATAVVSDLVFAATSCTQVLERTGNVLDEPGPGASLDDAFGGADGLSALGPVVFELDRPVDPASVTADGGRVLAVHDADTGERQPTRAPS